MLSSVVSGKKISWISVVVLLVFSLVLTIVISVKSVEAEEGVLPDGESFNKRCEFIESLGYEVDDTVSEEKQNILIPSEFSDVYENYNALQKQVGFNLLPFAGSKAEQYTLKLRDTSRNDVYAHLMVLNGKIIGGDISALSISDGYMLPLG